MDRYQFDPVEKEALESLRVPLAVYQFIDKRVVTLILSDGLCEVFGYNDKSEAYFDMDNNMYKDTHPDDKARIADDAFRFAVKDGKYEVVYRTKTKSGCGYKIIHSKGEHVFRPDGTRLAYIWYIDEGEYIEDETTGETILTSSFRSALHEESILKASYYDELTGLPSMSYFFELADTWRKKRFKNDQSSAVIYMDLCGMKYYNKKYGFAEGDNLLRAFADILKEIFSNENCSRFGSDHFCVFTEAEGLESKLKRVFREFGEALDGNTIPVRVGISVDRDGSNDVSTECDRAKYACDTMRNSYSSQYRFFDESMHKKIEYNRYIVENLDRAIKEKWIKVYYQPIIRAANGRVCDEEALARWIDPEKGMISPADFIPVLEESKLIYKLDLYIVDQVLEKMTRLRNEGLYVVPGSVNLSRADFDACDIVEEIRKRVDASGFDRKMLSIEVTESVLGQDFDFMAKQIIRFRELGFCVWMDDFGSGYSSLDVLQSIRFDLIKFDMRFMKEFGKSSKNKIILTELIRMAIALGVDTVCEGVETKEQAEFLQEVGCTKLQGYYFCRPLPLEDILKRYHSGAQIGFENQDETEYYAAIGKINLYDLAIISNEDEISFEHYFNTLPMAIFEVNDEAFRVVRCNSTYRSFMEKLLGVLALGVWIEFSDANEDNGKGFLKTLKNCGINGNKIMLDEEMGDGSIAHAFIKRVSVNPVTGNRAVAVAVLAVIDKDETPLTFEQIAKALSADYISLFYLDLKTEKFFEFNSEIRSNELEVERHGRNFFDACRIDAMKLLHEDDRENFINTFTKENILAAIKENGVFVINFRQNIDGVSTYVSLKAVHPKGDDSHLIVGVSNIDAQVRQKEDIERMKEEQITFARVAALSGDFICIYSVDPETNRYMLYSARQSFKGLEVPTDGDDFFADSLQRSKQLIVKDDLEHFRKSWSKEKMLSDINRKGVFTLKYHMIIEDTPTKVSLKATLVEEKGGPQLIIGVTSTEARVRRSHKQIRGED